MGMDPATLAIIGGTVMGGAADIWGANSQNNANSQNLAMQLQRQQMMQQYVNGLIQPGVNPMAQAMLNFVGQGVPGSFNGFSGVSPVSGGNVTSSTGQPPGGYGGTSDPNNPN